MEIPAALARDIFKNEHQLSAAVGQIFESVRFGASLILGPSHDNRELINSVKQGVSFATRAEGVSWIGEVLDAALAAVPPDSEMVLTREIADRMIMELTKNGTSSTFCWENKSPSKPQPVETAE